MKITIIKYKDKYLYNFLILYVLLFKNSENNIQLCSINNDKMNNINMYLNKHINLISQ